MIGMEQLTDSQRHFWDYFSVADELDGGMPLEYLDEGFIESARQAALERDLPWPPYLPAAEDYSLSHYEELRS